MPVINRIASYHTDMTAWRHDIHSRVRQLQKWNAARRSLQRSAAERNDLAYSLPVIPPARNRVLAQESVLPIEHQLRLILRVFIVVYGIDCIALGNVNAESPGKLLGCGIEGRVTGDQEQRAS